jgi:hypothetical protein
MQTIFYVQGFRTGHGGVVPAVLLLRARESEALWAAELLAERYDGVLAWRQDGDEEAGEYDDPLVLVSRGEVPSIDELRERA